jgi:hypothetical protein
MADASRRAARAAAKGGLPNALFVVAAAEQLPAALHGIADELTIQFPWGSLLRGALALDRSAAASGIAALLASEGTATVTFSIEDRDRLDLPTADAAVLAGRWCTFGLDVCGFRDATPGELREMPSTWGRRLAAGQDRRAWRLQLARSDDASRRRG